MTTVDSPEVMAEAIGSTSVSLLGRENLRALHAQVNRACSNAIVWVELRDESMASQLETVGAFASVRELYEEEIALDLRFGAPIGVVSETSAVKSLVAA